jgi:hypothetical protein
MTMTRIEGIDFELEADGVSIEQHDGCGNPVDSIYLHKVVLAHLAAEMGLLDKSAGDAELHKENATLKRRITVLHDRISRLDYMLAQCGHHEDLGTEQAFAFATWEISQEFVAEMSAPEADEMRTALPDSLVSPARSKHVAKVQHSDSKPIAIATAQLELEPSSC